VTKVISTSRFGTVEIQADRIIHFSVPILGFDRCQSFVLLEHQKNSPFEWLQSTEDPDLAFIVSHPAYFKMDYPVVIPDETLEQLAIKSEQDVLIYTIINIPDDNPKAMTANLLGPIIINIHTMQAVQIVLSQSQYHTRHLLLPSRPPKNCHRRLHRKLNGFLAVVELFLF
jgi:flagellar assembly factor FliW